MLRLKVRTPYPFIYQISNIWNPFRIPVNFVAIIYTIININNRIMHGPNNWSDTKKWLFKLYWLTITIGGQKWPRIFSRNASWLLWQYLDFTHAPHPMTNVKCALKYRACSKTRQKKNTGNVDQNKEFHASASQNPQFFRGNLHFS